MVNRSGFSIRRFISQHRPRADDDFDDESESSDERDSRSVRRFIQNHKRSKSWVPISRKRSISASTSTRRAHGAHRASSPLPPVPVELPQLCSSSSLSLSSCEGHTDTVTSDLHADPQVALPLCLNEDGQTTLHRIPPKRPPRPMSPQLTLSKETGTSGHKSPRLRVSLSDPGLERHRLMHQLDDTRAVRNDESPKESSKNVQQLILETDETFKAILSAVEDAKIACLETCKDLDAAPAPSPVVHRLSKPMPVRRTSSGRDPRPRDATSPSQTRTAARSGSVKKPKGKKGTKNRKSGTMRKVTSQVRVPKWVLSENVTDILTGQRFRRIEADEMLTPAQIEQLRLIREEARRIAEELELRNSSDSDRSGGLEHEDPTTESPKPEEVPLEDNDRGVKSTIAVSVEPTPPSVPSDRDVVHQDFSVPSTSPETEKPTEKPATDSSKGPLPSEPKTTALPSIPQKSPLRSRPGKLQKRLLSTIPEVIVTTPDKEEFQLTGKKRPRMKPILRTEEDAQFYYLKSTPYTLTKPAFRHGSIVFAKSDVGKGAKAVDDTLDWTAFQMAILGGAGDLCPDTSFEEDMKQAEDVSAWFDSFGFETYGKLIPGQMTSSRDSAQSNLSSSPSTIDSEAEPPIPVGAEYPSGFWNISSSVPTLDAIKFSKGTGLKRWRVEDRPRRYTAQSPESLPPSPMMPLVVQSGDTSACEAVPMGYNLGHDLGDFLRWEAQHGYAGGY